MSLTTPNLAIGRLSPRSTSSRLLSLYGTPIFFINSFRLVSLLAFLARFNLSFLTGALAFLIKITKAAPFESTEVFREDPFLAPYFFLFSSMIFLLLCLFYSAAFFMLTTWPFSPPPFSVSAFFHSLVDTIQALIRQKR